MSTSPPVRIRREPPAFRLVAVRRTEELSARMMRITLTGEELAGLAIDEPAASVRLLLPSAPGELEIPTWTGNLFVLADGRRATIRTLTPRRFEAGSLELDLDIVLHGEGAASEWAAHAQPGDPAAISGPARGYTIDTDAAGFVLAGDETALPAIGQLLEALPRGASVHVLAEVPGVRLALPDHPSAVVQWIDAAAVPGEALVTAVVDHPLPNGVKVWAAGEAAAMQRIRRHLFEERGLPRSMATVRGYWKYGRAGDGDDV
jgi:NADPH-dependent ferric siderophore reductase